MKRTGGLEALTQTLQTEKLCHLLKEALPTEGRRAWGHTAGSPTPRLHSEQRLWARRGSQPLRELRHPPGAQQTGSEP